MIHYWNAVARDWSRTPRQGLWRGYCDELNARLFRPWMREAARLTLKTDLFDEAAGAGLRGLLTGASSRVVGVDLAPEMVKAAGWREPPLASAGADVRRLPFRDAVFDRVVSNSTLDHFETISELRRALAELRRVLRPGGELLLTLDNLDNPVIALRARLPFPWLARAGVVPYYVGATCGRAELDRLLREAGFTPLEYRSVMHCPRMLAVFGAALLDRLGWRAAKRAYLRGLFAWEALERLPTRHRTGYFIAVRAARAASHLP